MADKRWLWLSFVCTDNRFLLGPRPVPLGVYIGGGTIFFGGGETKNAEGIRDAKNRRFVIYIAFAGKSGGGGGTAPGPQAPPPMVFKGFRHMITGKKLIKK